MVHICRGRAYGVEEGHGLGLGLGRGRPGRGVEEMTSASVLKALSIEQGVHIGEFHYLEDLASEQVYEFVYIAATNKIKGSTAGFTMRPLAVY